MTIPGPGDTATWPAYVGHPNDPRATFHDPCVACDGEGGTWRHGCERCDDTGQEPA